MAKKKTIKKIIKADGNNWQIATAAHEDEIKELLTEGFEPYSVDQGIYYLKKKGT